MTQKNNVHSASGYSGLGQFSATIMKWNKFPSNQQSTFILHVAVLRFFVSQELTSVAKNSSQKQPHTHVDRACHRACHEVTNWLHHSWQLTQRQPNSRHHLLRSLCKVTSCRNCTASKLLHIKSIILIFISRVHRYRKILLCHASVKPHIRWSTQWIHHCSYMLVLPHMQLCISTIIYSYSCTYNSNALINTYTNSLTQTNV